MGSSLEAYAKDYFARHGKVKRGMPSQTAKMSNGFLGIVFALHLCAKVDIYGFDQASPSGTPSDCTSISSALDAALL